MQPILKSLAVGEMQLEKYNCAFWELVTLPPLTYHLAQLVSQMKALSNENLLPSDSTFRLTTES